MTQTTRKRRRIQFRLRTLMIVVTVLAVACGYVGWQAKFVRERNGMLDWIARHGGRAYPLIDPRPNEMPPLVRRLLGDEPIGAVILRGPITAEERRSIAARLPEATIADGDQVTGPSLP
jgi:hypothetical protein